MRRGGKRSRHRRGGGGGLRVPDTPGPAGPEFKFGGSGRSGGAGSGGSWEPELPKRIEPLREKKLPMTYGRFEKEIPKFKRGGTMRKAGVAKLHKGERIKGRRRSR